MSAAGAIFPGNPGNTGNPGDKVGPYAFLGMGIMGAAMAVNLMTYCLSRGQILKVWNRTPGRPGLELAVAAGAQATADEISCVQGASVVFSCLGDEKDVFDRLTNLGPHFGQGAIVVDFSTIGPQAARRTAAALAEYGVVFLDAPVTGGDIGAREGTLTIMVGGEQSAFQTVLPLLQSMGKRIAYCGPSGNGQALKLVNQTLCALNLVGVCEALHMAETMGLDPAQVAEVLENGAGGSWALSNLGRRICKGDLAPGFAVKHMLKDLRLVFENLPPGSLPGTSLSAALFEKALQVVGPETGLELGTHAMIRAYEGKL